MKAARGGVVASDLRKHFVSVGVKDTHSTLIASSIDGTFHDVRTFVREGIIDNDGRALRLRVHLLYGGSDTGGEFLGKGAVGQVVLVVGVIVGSEDARTRQAVVVLLPKGSYPGIAQLLGGILADAEPHGKCRSLLGSIGQQLVLAVPKLQGAPAGVGAHTMHAHR